jgi:flagellar basal body-associated protein FliL
VTEIAALYWWTRAQLGVLADRRRAAAGDPQRGDGILIWVVMTALLAAAAIAIVAIIVAKAKSTATNTQTQ